MGANVHESMDGEANVQLGQVFFSEFREELLKLNLWQHAQCQRPFCSLCKCHLLRCSRTVWLIVKLEW